MVTIKEIASRAGVAKSTVSNVLTGKKYVSPEITKKVREICKELNYQPNFYASVLSAKAKTNIIGLFLEESIDGKFRKFYSDLIAGCISTLTKYGNNLLVYTGLNIKETLIKLQAGKAPIDGAIILSPTINDERILNITGNMMPIVTIGKSFDKEISSIDIQNTLLVKMVANQMVRRGYERIYLINSNEKLTISKERDQGIIEALKDKRIDFTIEHTDSTEEDGYRVALEGLRFDANAFITASEVVASGVYRACKELGKRIPEDVCVFSLGCNPETDIIFNPPLSYAYQDYNVLGSKACEILMENIRGNKDIVHETVQGEIYYQESFRLK